MSNLWKDYMNPVMNSLMDPSTQNWSDWHANNTIYFGELIESGFDWGKNDYFQDESFTVEDRTRLNKKIEDRYYYREICCTPPGKFKLFLTRKLNELLPKYNELYKLIASGDFHVLRQETKNTKYRHIFSEYPQTQLKGDADYATNAQDNAAGSIVDGPPVDMFVDYHMRYDDIDVMILDQLDVCFYSQLNNTINGGV